MRCPHCEEAVHIQVDVTLNMPWSTALKLRLMGKAAAARLLDELALQMTEHAMQAERAIRDMEDE